MRKHKKWLAALFLAFLVVMGWQLQKHLGACPSRIVKYTVGSVTFSFPRNVSPSYDGDKLSGKSNFISFDLLYPQMTPVCASKTGSSKEILESKIGIFVHEKLSDVSLERIFRNLDPSKSNISVEKIYGLERLHVPGKVPYDVYIKKNDAGTLSWMAVCNTKDILPNPLCKSYVMDFDPEIRLHYKFAYAQISNWQDIDSKVRKFLKDIRG